VASEPFATTGDLEDRWEDLDEARTRRAEALLAAASRLVRKKVPGIDVRFDLPEDSSDWLDRELVTDIVCEMVREVMSLPTPGATQQSSTVGSVSSSTSFGVAAGRLRLTRDQLEQLSPVVRRRGAASVSSLPASYERSPGAEGIYPG
jgi:hypothetical protein